MTDNFDYDIGFYEREVARYEKLLLAVQDEHEKARITRWLAVAKDRLTQKREAEVLWATAQVQTQLQAGLEKEAAQ